MTNPIEVLAMIEADLEEDVRRWDGAELTGRTVATMHGELAAAIAAVAHIVADTIAAGTQPGGVSSRYPGSSPGLPLAPERNIMTRPVEPTHDPTPEPPAPRENDGRTHFFGDGCDPPHIRPDKQRVTIVIELPAPLGAVSAVLSAIGEHWPDANVDTSDPKGWRIEVLDRWPE